MGESDETTVEEVPKGPEPTHWLHLANGDVLESAGTMTHYKGIPVIGSYPIVKKEDEK